MLSQVVVQPGDQFFSLGYLLFDLRSCGGGERVEPPLGFQLKVVVIKCFRRRAGEAAKRLGRTNNTLVRPSRRTVDVANLLTFAQSIAGGFEDPSVCV